MVRCGKCGQSGHNRRTCGQQKTSPAPTLHYTRPPNPVVPQTVAEVFRQLEQLDPQQSIAPQKEPGCPETAPPNLPEESFSAKDLQTWWRLSSPQMKRHYLEDDELDNLIQLYVTAEKCGTPVEELAKFFSTVEQYGKEQLAEREDCPASLVDILAEDTSSSVKRAVAERNDLSETTVKKLLFCGVPAVASTTLDMHPELSEDTLGKFIAYQTEQETALTQGEYFKIYEDGYDYSDTDGEEPSPTNDWLVHVLQHGNCPTEYLVSTIRGCALEDEECAVALANERTPAEVLEETYYKAMDESSYQDSEYYDPELDDWETSGEEKRYRALESILGNRHTPPHLLHKFMSEYSFFHRSGKHTPSPNDYPETYNTALRNPSVTSDFLVEEYNRRFTRNGSLPEIVESFFIGHANFPASKLEYILNSEPHGFIKDMTQIALKKKEKKQ